MQTMCTNIRFLISVTFALSCAQLKLKVRSVRRYFTYIYYYVES